LSGKKRKDHATHRRKENPVTRPGITGEGRGPAKGIRSESGVGKKKRLLFCCLRKRGGEFDPGGGKTEQVECPKKRTPFQAEREKKGRL